MQVGALGNAVGIGGGAFFVPLGEVLLGFSEAVIPSWLLSHGLPHDLNNV